MSWVEPVAPFTVVIRFTDGVLRKLDNVRPVYQGKDSSIVAWVTESGRLHRFPLYNIFEFETVAYVPGSETAQETEQ